MTTSGFWAMGGYGFFVWGSYAAVAVGIAFELWALRARRSRAVSAVTAGTR